MARLGRAEWIGAGLEALMEDGVEGVVVESLARRLGVTKGSFYWHFGGRGELLTALLEAWEEAGTARIIEEVDQEGEEPVERLRRLAKTIFQVTPYDRLEIVIRSWAASSDEARQVVRRVDRRRLEYVAGLLRGSGMTKERARLWSEGFYRTVIGEFVYRSTGGRPLEEAAIDELLGGALEQSTKSWART